MTMQSVRTYTEGALRDIAIQVEKYVNDPHSTAVDGDRLVDEAVAKARTAANLMAIAKRDAVVAIAKTEEKPKMTEIDQIIAKHGPHATLRSLAEDEINTIAVGIQKARPELTNAQAVTAALANEQGAELYAAARGAWADLPIAVAAAKAAYKMEHGRSDDAWADAVEYIAKRDNCTQDDAWRRAIEEYPSLYDAYRRRAVA